MKRKKNQKTNVNHLRKPFTHSHWNVVLKSFWLDFLANVCSSKMLRSWLERQKKYQRERIREEGDVERNGEWPKPRVI